jgi:GNAT superfamily N-acetyltransferase
MCPRLAGDSARGPPVNVGAAAYLHGVPKSRGRKTKKATRKGSGPRGPDSVLRRGQLAPGRLRMSDDKIADLLANDQIPADMRIMLLLPLLWLSAARGRPGNICVDACMTLRRAYGQFGITAELRAVQLVVRTRSGQLIQHSGPEPSWDGGAVLAGHCVLWLPESGRFIDPTVEQFPEVARYKRGPVVGRAPAAGRLPAGARLEVPRGDLTLLYTVLDGRHTATVVNAHQVTTRSDEVRRAGINLASWALAILRLPDFAGRARMAPFPRLRALLGAVSDAPGDLDEETNWRFAVHDPGGTRRLLLEEIPLPPGTPGDAAAGDPAVLSAAPATPVRRLTPRMLPGGMPGPGGVSLRLARPGETAAVSRLLAAADAGLAADVAVAVEDGTIAATLLKGLADGQDQLIRALAIAAHANEPETAMPGLSVVLVAEAAGDLAGAIEARPPSWIFAEAAGNGVPLAQALLGTAVVIKICAVAVAEPARRRGIGGALINACTELYFQLGYHLTYGQFSARAGLAPYYKRLGFTVQAPGAAISLSEPLGLPVAITATPGDRLFTRWR